jgi:hypothetical protein
MQGLLAEGLGIHSSLLTWILTCVAGAAGALLKELVTSTKRYRRSKIPPWREAGEDGYTTSGAIGYIALVTAELIIGVGVAIAVAVAPLILTAAAASGGGAIAVGTIIGSDR